MTPLPLALSISNTFTQVGAIAAFAALVGIAALSLLVFSQARELKRLREWAGRAPERAAELEQRVSAAAAARVPPRPGTQQVRPIPRAAPINARPITEAPLPAMGAANPAAASAAAANPAPATAAAANP